MTPDGRGIGPGKRGHRHACAATMLAASLALALPMAAAAAAAERAVIPAMVRQPRAFGHVLGDVLTQRILLRAGDGDADRVAPPAVGRTGTWLERRRVRFETDTQGRRWMAIDYQIVNAAPVPTTIALPALTLASPSGATLRIAEWPVSVSPITPDDTFNAGDLQPMRPDRQAPLPPTGPIRRQAGFALGLWLLTLLSWAGWWMWRNRRESVRLPFARAWRQMRRLDPSHVDTSPLAWRCLHRALDETAGQVVHADSLPGLFARAPYLRPLRVPLEHFYRQSAERFFTLAPAEAAYPLQALCRELYRAERRYRR
ncbi:calcium incorporation protein MxaA [Burkholderia anthina]|uniref:calcium incorporation protein MxaA n=1 Tax=Burkholderia anthina TaxID=179879 RepID=UPI001AA062AF|nr:calcium incorporation protein MxaA [Burkholderia anthina]